MAKQWHTNLSRRERQIMDIIYKNEKATVAEVRGNLPDPPSYSSVRATLRILERKGYLKHDKEGPRYVFFPTVPREKARQSLIRQVLHTFFDGSVEQAVAALLHVSRSDLSDQELERLARLIEEAKKEGR